MKSESDDPHAVPAGGRGQLPVSVLDLLLRLAPVNALLFNARLTCDYAAPIDDTLMGRPRDALLGRSAGDLLQAARDGLTPHLRRAAREGRGWSDEEYRFVDPAEANRRYCWSVHVDPIRVPAYRGVLVTWQDIQRNSEERETMRAEVAALRRDAAEREAASLRLYADLRSAVTPVSGYLQMIARRPSLLRGRSSPELIRTRVLPSLRSLLAVVERLRRPPFTRSDAMSGVGGARQ